MPAGKKDFFFFQLILLKTFIILYRTGDIFICVNVIVIASQKGGVGKTTAAINLSYSMANKGYRVVLIDTDSQGSVGHSLSRNTKKRYGFYDAILGEVSFEELIINTKLPNYNIITAGYQSDLIDEHQIDINNFSNKVRLLFQGLNPQEVDFIVVDTSAGIGAITSSIIKQSTTIIIPQQAEPLGVRSVPQVLKKILGIRREGSKINIAGILMTMVNSQLRECVEAESQLRSVLPPSIMFQTSIPRDNVFLRASSLGVPVGLLSKNPLPAAIVFDQVVAELEIKLGISNISTQENGIKGLLD